MPRMTDDELLALIASEEAGAMGGADSGELASARAKNLKYYLGEPFGDEQEGQSSVVIPDVAEVVDNLLPSLLRIFTSVENTVVFEPVGPEDEEVSQQESDYVNHVFWKENQGFLIIYQWLKDGLLQKNGFVQAVWDEAEAVEREEYEGLSDAEYDELLADEELTPLEHSEETELEFNEALGLALPVRKHDVAFERRSLQGNVVVEPVSPEGLLVSTDATLFSFHEVRFVAHKQLMTRADLIAMGIEKDLVLNLPAVHASKGDTEEEIARRHLSDETEGPVRVHKLLEQIEVLDSYPLVDYDGDGVAERRQVLRAGQELAINEPVDRHPFHAWTPIPLPHKFFGLCPADQAFPLQRIDSALVRQMLDNLYLTNQPRRAIWEEAIGDSTMDELLSSRVGGVIRTTRPPAEALQEQTVTFVAQAAFPMLEWLQAFRRRRTGVGEDVQGLNVESLKNIQTNVVAQSLDMARMQIEAIARVFAETGLKSLFLHIHEMLNKHQDRTKVVKLRNQWVKIKPTEWRDRTDMTVLVGLGAGTRDQKLLHLMSIAQLQEKIAGSPFANLVQPQNVYNTAAQFVQNAEFRDPNVFFTDPASAPPQQPQSDPNADALIAIQARQQQLDAQKQQLDAQKAQLDFQAKMEKQELEKQKVLSEIQQRHEELRAKLTELELKYGANVPGSVV